MSDGIILAIITMRVVIQRVKNAKVDVSNHEVARIGEGLLVLCGFEVEETDEDLRWMASKICKLRLFDDEKGDTNLSIKEESGEILVVRQFTLHASTKKAYRPSYVRAAPSSLAILFYNRFLNLLEVELGSKIATGVFGEMMEVSLVNNGPVTIVMDSKNREF